MGVREGEPDLRLLALRFQPGVSLFNVIGLLYAGFITIAMLSYMTFIQPFVLGEILGIPPEEQGKLTGNLVVLQEIVVIALMGFSGAMSDRIGRRAVFVGGYLVLAAGFFLYPLVGSALQLYGARALFAVGVAIAPVMITACAVDYIREESRGRWVGVVAVATASGAMFMALVLSQLPDLYMRAGADSPSAARYAYWTATAVCLLTAVVLRFVIARGPVKAQAARQSTWEGVVAGVRAGVADARLSLALCGGFIGRGDFAVIGTFFSLWLMQAGMAKGMGAGESLAYAGRLFGVIQLSAVVWGVVMGHICDRMNRTSALAVASSFSVIGYAALALVPDPFAPSMLGVAVLAGIGEVSVVVAAGALLGQQAPAARRGAVSGLYGVLGALGIGVVGVAGGQLFDRVAWTAPFALMMVLNAVLLAWALALRFGERRSEAAPQGNA